MIPLVQQTRYRQRRSSVNGELGQVSPFARLTIVGELKINGRTIHAVHAPIVPLYSNGAFELASSVGDKGFLSFGLQGLPKNKRPAPATEKGRLYASSK